MFNWSRRVLVLAAVAAASGAGDGRAAELIAHRGASHDAPENTLAAVKLAWERGADAVEIDVRLSRDGRIVLMHDSTIRRTAGIDAKVAHLTLAELKSFDVGRWKGAEWSGERIPTLAEVLAALPEGKRLFIELKVGREIVPELTRVLKESRLPPERIAIIGSSLRTLEAAKLALGGIPVYWIVSARQHPESGEWLPSVGSRIRRATEAGLDGLDFKLAELIDGASVEQVRKAGLEFYVWTVNSPDEARRLRRAGVNGITTDRPEHVREQVSVAADRDQSGE